MLERREEALTVRIMQKGAIGGASYWSVWLDAVESE